MDLPGYVPALISPVSSDSMCSLTGAVAKLACKEMKLSREVRLVTVTCHGHKAPSDAQVTRGL